MTSPDDGADPTAQADAAAEAGTFDALKSLDPLGFIEAWSRTAAASLKNPEALTADWGRYVSGLVEASAAAADRARGSGSRRRPSWRPACSTTSRRRPTSVRRQSIPRPRRPYAPTPD